jgi:hypothetical protein
MSVIKVNTIQNANGTTALVIAANGQLSRVNTAIISDGTYSTSANNVIQGSAKAWVYYSNAGTVNGSYNVSSVTQNSTGFFTINFTNALPDTNYAWAQSTTSPGSGAPVLAELNGRSTTQLPIRSGYYYSGGWVDYSSFSFNGIVVFR